MWKWQWQQESEFFGKEHDECPQHSCVEVSVVELVDSLQDRGNFGELEMLRLGGGACGCDGVCDPHHPTSPCTSPHDCGRLRECTAKAMDDSHLSMLR